MKILKIKIQYDTKNKLIVQDASMEAQYWCRSDGEQVSKKNEETPTPLEM